MRKHELARKLARKTGITRAEAADQVDRLVNEILQKLRSGEAAQLPGLGRFLRNAEGNIEFQRDSSL